MFSLEVREDGCTCCVPFILKDDDEILEVARIARQHIAEAIAEYQEEFAGIVVKRYDIN